MLRFGLVLLAFSGCVSFPYAHLVSAEAQLEAVKSPVVCGPIGFRKIPLQARWGEYVKVTVAAPGALKGTALVHAGGVALEPFAWSTETTGALVVEARFPNEDPDRRFVLERERPIDVTLTGLEGTCEGAVFTVEHGVLVPTIDERAWMAELERRGGPELAARHEAARVEAEARRQAHYALWESRQHVEVSAEVVAQAEVIRQQHYAQWEARRSEIESLLPPGGEGQGEGVTASAEVGGDISVASSCGGSCAGSSAGGAVAVAAVTTTPASCGGSFPGSPAGGAVAVAAVTTTPASCGGSCAGSSQGVALINTTSTQLIAESSPTCLGNGAAHTVSAETTTSIHDTASTVVTSPAEWAQPSETSLRATAQTTWAQPSDAQLRAGVAVEETWSQPYQPRLEPVAVSTETHVVGTTAQVEEQQVQVEVVQPAAVIVPAMFQLMFNVAAAAGGAPQQPVHGARPAR